MSLSTGRHITRMKCHERFKLRAESPNIWQRAIWECQKILGNWTPSNGGHKLLRDAFSNFSRTEIFKFNPIRARPNLNKNFLQIGSCEKVFCPHSAGGGFCNQQQKHGGHKNCVFYAPPATLEITKMAVLNQIPTFARG